MIIGISGYIHSGKDTVGNIIQYLSTPKSDISYTGSYNSWVMDKGMGGQDTSGWEVKKFAGKLKQIASMLTGIPVEKFEDQEFKKTFLPKEWNKEYTYPFSGPEHTKVDEPMTVREFLQKLGTEGMRDGVHKNIWVNALFADYEQLSYDVYHKDKLVIPAKYPNWIITDTRFPNEAQAIKDRGGIVIRVNRFRVADLGETKLHPSETSLDDWNFDYIIDNNGTMEELTLKVQEMLEDFKLLK